jgi:uracil-DNA glycosylase
MTVTATTAPTWADVLGAEKQKPYFRHILDFLEKERAAGKTIYPEQAHIFNALKFTPFENIKVVILGQDPYHGPGQAH